MDVSHGSPSRYSPCTIKRFENVISRFEVLGKVDLAKLRYFVAVGCEVAKTTVIMYHIYLKYFLVYLVNEITSHLIY